MNSNLGYLRVATIVPPLEVGNVAHNVDHTVAAGKEAAARAVDIACFPELGLTGYTCADLFGQQRLVEAAGKGLFELARRTASLQPLLIVGLPVRFRSRLFNGAAVLHQGRILGIVPKSYLPNYGEFYEKRWFASGADLRDEILALDGLEIPFGTDLLFDAEGVPAVSVGIELCEDLWAPSPPSIGQALAGATVLFNLSASNDLVGKAQYRRRLVSQQSARCLAAYVYCSAGPGESTTDVVYGGHRLIAENGHLLCDERDFGFACAISTRDIDVEFLVHERCHDQTYADAAARQERAGLRFRSVPFRLAETACPAAGLQRVVEPLPFVPAADGARHEVCQEIFAIQSTGLATRLRHTGMRDVVIGLSGGLDSTLALMVCVEACNRLDLPRSGIHGITMPGYGTTKRTVANVRRMCERLAVPLAEIDIVPACRQHLADLGHPEDLHDVAFENVQARERTQILMDRANMLGGLVVGTGDLSELALGWCTYNADHMSMYAVNCGVPKTLVAFLVEYVADTWHDGALSAILRDVLATPISPELLPPDEKGLIAQKTEEVIGPYELHDFFLYYLVRCGFPPRKVFLLACRAFAKTYAEPAIGKWLALFIRRFFAQQFKRSCLPDGPKVGTIALSPRGDWRMPSDASAAAWLADCPFLTEPPSLPSEPQ